MTWMKRVASPIAVAGLLISLSPSAWAQRGEQEDTKSVSVSKVERLNRAPVSEEILQVKLPRPVEFTLSNGLTVLVMEDHRLPTISVSLRIEGAGGLFQPAENLAVAPAMASLMRTGTTTRDSRQIAEEQDRLGMTLDGSAGNSSTFASFSASGLSDNFDDWFALVADILLNPTFTEEEIRKHASRLKPQLRQFETLPVFISISRFNKSVYGDHPLHRLFPTGAHYDALTSESLMAWHRERVTPQNSIMGIVGDVDPETLRLMLEQVLGGWQRTSLEIGLPEGPERTDEKRVLLVHRPGSVQTTLRMGNLAIDRRHPDYYVSKVTSRILGGGPASRLFLNLREEKGYAYGVSASFAADRFQSPWQANSNVRTEVTQGAMEQFYWEFYRLRNQLVDEDELEAAKRAIVAQFALQLEDPSFAIENEITRRLFDFPEEYWADYPARIMEVTADDVQRFAREYLSLDDIQIVAVGDAPKIVGVLESYGPVTVYDADGNEMDPSEFASPEGDPDVQGEPADVAGEWEMTVTNSRGETRMVRLVLEQSGTGISGTIAGPGGRENPVTGTVAGNEIRFSMRREIRGGVRETAYSGTATGDTMSGKLESMGYSVEWTAKRKI